ncbi:flagellinolysin [Serpentinicella alkaliphila]|uniref:Flagellin n=1 Tax=Serpentinicella alkaliphila TaxID=1734049 RepID=A0A4V2T3U0_9FIRM|nr:flagellinolysin [Serpentinicella alkaliphila]TCQ02724.1 flagellin [Serpentinicella alkaliphila]
MRINNNMVATNTYRQLTINNVAGGKAMEKLSSGSRINRAGDDVAGLAISEKMRGQIRGLNQASRNAQDGISMIQTFEGALNETHTILQRMRELTVQAANDTNINSDRKQINDEIAQLRQEVDRIANNTEFNTQKLMNYGASLQADGFPGISQEVINTLNTKIPEWINDSLEAIRGRFGIELNATKRDLTVVYETDVSYGAAVATSDLGASLELRINLDAFTDSNGNLISEGQLDTLVAHEVMHALQYTEMTDLLLGTPALSDEEIWFMEGLSMAVQGANSWIASITGGITNADISGVFGNTYEDYASAFVAIKTLHEITEGGINAIINELEAGNSLDVAILNTVQRNQGEVSGAGIDHTDYAGGDTGYHSWSEFVADFNGGQFDTYLSSSTDFTLGTGAIVEGDVAGSSSNLTLDQTITNDTGLATAYTVYNISFTTDSASTVASDTPEKVILQIGANNGQTIEIDAFDATANGLRIDTVNATTQENADNSISLLDAALTSVSNFRSSLGALQNRLEHSIKNIDTSSENLQASESRIRDLDMAKEMMTFTKNNILQQAAQAMLAQANQAPQGVLQLLR